MAVRRLFKISRKNAGFVCRIGESESVDLFENSYYTKMILSLKLPQKE